jgi:pentatricopeptide repeat protein
MNWLLQFIRTGEDPNPERMALYIGANQLATNNPMVHGAWKKGCVLFDRVCRFKGEVTIPVLYKQCWVNSSRFMQQQGMRTSVFATLKGQAVDLYVRCRFELDKDTFIDGWVNRSKQAGWIEGKFSMREEIVETQKKYPYNSTEGIAIRLLKAFCKMGLWEGTALCMAHNNRIFDAVKLFDEMRSKGINLDVTSYSALIKRFCNAGKLEEAEWWYQNMIAASGTSCRRTWKPLWSSVSCYVAVEELLHLTTTFPHGFSWPLLLCVKEEGEAATFGGNFAGTGITIVTSLPFL